ncbi:MAG: hypothetical protein ABI409_05530 [Ramlibacter sp.]
MKIAALLTAAALASGSALAAQNSSNYDSRDTATTHKAPVVVKDKPAAVANDAKPKEGIVERTKGAVRRMGEKLGHATERLPGNKSSNQAMTDPSRADTSRSDTRSMGAAASDDSGRQRRMDDAYNNWRARQQ